MKNITKQQVEDLACKHHWYACGRAPNEAVVAEHVFEADGLMAFAIDVQRHVESMAIKECRNLCEAPKNLFDDGYNAALSDFEDEIKRVEVNNGVAG